ncbi:hypothetical protein FGO68_gene7567 [Halteria grandinella]|uniref:Transmembrane protein n=1 Tax=Halteria grandinella TaxID=5974 RepID=A0A8J8NHB3_HALGN|nr:hypothetical protein FGO68_gene7567 [Halteria grandinella]
MSTNIKLSPLSLYFYKNHRLQSLRKYFFRNLQFLDQFHDQFFVVIFFSLQQIIRVFSIFIKYRKLLIMFSFNLLIKSYQFNNCLMIFFISKMKYYVLRILYLKDAIPNLLILDLENTKFFTKFRINFTQIIRGYYSIQKLVYEEKIFLYSTILCHTMPHKISYPIHWKNLQIFEMNQWYMKIGESRIFRLFYIFILYTSFLMLFNH